jgi:hypothetical protein
MKAKLSMPRGEYVLVTLESETDLEAGILLSMRNKPSALCLVSSSQTLEESGGVVCLNYRYQPEAISSTLQ